MSKHKPLTGARAIRAAQRRGDLPQDFYFDPEMENRKRKLVEKYGTEPTITYYYFLLNVVDYAGEERVRQSFESIAGQGDVIVGDYSSTDRTKEIAEEYGFKVVTVKKTPGIKFHDSKIVNKAIFEAKTNFMADLNIHMEYPKYMGDFCRKWIQQNDITKKQLWMIARLLRQNGTPKKVYGGPILIYRPYLILTRGNDERTRYGFGEAQYIAFLLNNVLQLSTDIQDLGINHKFHGHIKWAKMREYHPLLSNRERHQKGEQLAKQLTNNLQRNFDEAVKEVVNSYW